MKIAILSTHDVNGGAAVSSFRLFKGLKKLDQNVEMLVMHKHSRASDISSVNAMDVTLNQKVTKRLKYWKIKSVKGVIEESSNIEKFSFEYSPYYWNKIADETDFDILNVHWVNGFIDFEGIYNLARGRKVVFTLHDMAHFTGGCHYSKGCSRYMDRCGNCPIIDSTEEHDISRKNWIQKRKYIRKIDHIVVAPSHWLAESARKSSLFQQSKVFVVPYGLDINHFNPGNSDFIRQRYPITENKFLLLTGALDNTLERKGTDLLANALQLLPNKLKDRICLILFGEGKIDIEGVLSFSLGMLAGEDLVNAYREADLFAIPSRQDNLPNTVLESLACGTPVIGFNIGGIPDMVEQGVNGLLAKPFNINSFAANIADFINFSKAKREVFEKNARQTVIDRFQLQMQSNRYKKIFEEHIH